MKNQYKAIIKQLKKYKTVIISGHVNPDFDSFASSLALYTLAKKYCKEAYIYLDLNTINSSLTKAVELIKNSEETFHIINSETVTKYIREDTLLIATDFSNKKLIECPQLLKLDTIVIDHHITDGPLKIITINELIDFNASSASEIITLMLNELKIPIKKHTATLLLVGIEVDTNGYIVKTTPDTFLAASLLLQLGANNNDKNEILKDTRENYLKKMNLIKKSYMITKNSMLCVLDNQIYPPKTLAEVADELIQFENVEASYVIGKTGNKKISISARSLGKINVQRIMKKLGGGGNKSSSATQLVNSSLKDAKQKLLEIIK